MAFAEWTEDEQLRQTTFLGWRDDKSPKEMVLEIAHVPHSFVWLRTDPFEGDKK